MSEYNIIASTNESTVVAEYIPEKRKASDFQSEAALEKEFIQLLISQKYEYLSVPSEEALLLNLRAQIERLNNYKFYDGEWERFCSEYLINKNEGIVEKTRKVQADERHSFRLDNGLTKNIAILDKTRIHNNHLQVINQYEESSGAHNTRYDVTILCNGLPLVHIELKRRGVAIREAFNQINRYQRDSFWASSGLFEYVQIFVISNGTHTKYYSNTTRNAHIKEMGGERRSGRKKTSNSFEFTSCWADAKNKTIDDLVDFTKTFFAKHTILHILINYCVFTSEDILLVMRPYQIAATEKILNRIKVATSYKQYGSLEGGGYIWHTTGSGKTLTSFKAAQMATELEGIQKVLFVVDRKDLDYQTMKEYDRFEKGAANSNNSTRVLKKQLEDSNVSIIITTIQKLGVFIDKNQGHEIFTRHVVLIFDECHRSQFGETHKAITKAFKKYHIFGFTGTPITTKNAGYGDPTLRTTKQAFGKELHTYTIVNAIKDGNVLPFRIDYINTARTSSNVKEKQVWAIDEPPVMVAPQRIQDVVGYVLEHFDQKTKRQSFYTHKRIINVQKVATDRAHALEDRVKEEKGVFRIGGFNSIFAVSNAVVIDGKKVLPVQLYYEEFKRQIAEQNRSLRIATIFSYASNEEELDTTIPDEDFDNARLDQSSRDFLERAIDDYNGMFGTKYDTSSERFQNYYKDVSLRMKNREIDLLIVVNMFLTGFDATTLNTLWVDRNLKYHGLIQAFSRTNRILNSVKTYGNIICFRNLEEATNKAIGLFGDPESGGIVLLKTYDDYYYGYKDEKGKQHKGYRELIEMLVAAYPVGETILGEAKQKDFIRLYGAIMRLWNILTAFDDFKDNEILSERDFQDYQSIYLDLYQSFKKNTESDKEKINDDIEFEIELIKQIEVNIDYILLLVAKYHESNCTDKEILAAVDKAVGSSIELRSKKELIDGFISRISLSTQVDDDWQKFVQEQKESDLAIIIDAERLKPEETRRLIDNAFRDGTLKTTGTDIDKILPPVSRFGSGGEDRVKKKQDVIDILLNFFEKYSGLM
jgi:type I restriction enzyme R subunit